MLTGSEISSFLRKARNFGGVYSIDNLPTIISKPSSFIINLDASHKPGSHWTAVAFSTRSAIYFDSYGRPPPDEILTFIERNSRQYEYSKLKYQGNDSTACGYFCMLFVSMANKRAFFKLLKDCNHKANDHVIYKKLKTLIK